MFDVSMLLMELRIGACDGLHLSYVYLRKAGIVAYAFLFGAGGAG
jgi:hypothetical protein